MKAFIYAKISENEGCSWHISLDMRADWDYWSERHGIAFKLWVLEPLLSFGQAYELLQLIPLGLSEKELSHGICNAARHLGVLDQRRSDWRLREWKPDWLAKLVTTDRIASTIKAFEEAMQGRLLLMDEFKSLMDYLGHAEMENETKYLLQLAYLQGRIELKPGITVERTPKRLLFFRKEDKYSCRRCGSKSDANHGTESGKSIVWTECPHCGGLCAYCEACLTMGRVRYCSPCISIPMKGNQNVVGMVEEKKPEPDLKAYLTTWGLSEVQTEASGLALQFLKANISLTRGDLDRETKPKFLIWAVTGAGKTEMIFPLIKYTLDQRGKVAVATPRRDVVLELKPRLEKVFPLTDIVTLYGGSEQRWDSGQLTIATTHQLLRFSGAFDIVIVDEIDAYPYHNNPMLQYAAERVCKKNGAYILLSATPPEKLQQAAKRNQLPHARVSARYHRHALPVPMQVNSLSIEQMIRQSQIDDKLQRAILISLERGAQMFIFVPTISKVTPMVGLLRRRFPSLNIEGTSSKDADRSNKVMGFRSGEIRILVTTTILERGVTIPKSDVFILDADSPIFDSAALVQMAGRAGRSIQDPDGLVYFIAKERTRSQVHAVKQIQEMNAIARKKGYLD